MWSEIFVIFFLFYFVESRDVTLTFLYDRTSYLPCEGTNSDNTSNWLKDNNLIDISADPNLNISPSGSLIFDKFSFSDTGEYLCQDSDLTYTLYIDCPSNSEPNALSNECVCSPGATKNPSLSSLACHLCPPATFKPSPGLQPCSHCPTSLLTEQNGSISISDCVCPPGEGIISDLCAPCPSDSYQDGFAKSPCIQCPLYSATPQPLGESDAEAFSGRSDCICEYSPGNAANSTCWPFVTSPVVSLVGVDRHSVSIQWLIQSFARADDGAYRGVVAGYHLEVRTTGPLRTNVFTQKYTPADYTLGHIFTLNITGLVSGTRYNILANAFTKSTSFVDGPPFNLTVMTSSPFTSTVPYISQQTSGTPELAHETTVTSTVASTHTTSTVVSTHTTSTVATTHSTSASSAPPTQSTTVNAEQHSNTTSTQSTTITTEQPSTSTVLTATSTTLADATPNDTVSLALGLLVVVLVIIIAAIAGCFLLRYCYVKKRGTRKMRYVRAPRGNGNYGMYTSTTTTFANSKDGDDVII